MNRIKCIALIAIALAAMAASAQKTITSRVCWLDGDITTSSAVSPSVDISTLSPGLHSYSMRVQDSNGLWSSHSTRYFIIPPPHIHEASAIVKREYWIDGKIEAKTTLSASPTAIDIGTLSTGLHSFTVRVQDNDGLWSSLSTRYFIIPPSHIHEASAIVKREYWIDGKIAAKATLSASPTAIDIGTLQSGLHSITVRVQDNDGLWSSLSTRYFIIPPSHIHEASAIENCEYWLDGKIEAKATLGPSPAAIDIGTLSTGLHSLTMRVKDNDGLWSSHATKYFIIPPIPDEDVILERCCYWFDDNNAEAVVVPIEQNKNIVEIDISHLSVGQHTLNWVVGDSKGAWSNILSQSFRYLPAVDIESFTVNDVTFNMVKVESGELNGTTITEFYIGQCEVTEELWQSVMGSNPSANPGTSSNQVPVESISWNDCQQFVKNLQRLTAVQWRLPSEAEWEFAARGGKRTNGFSYSGSNTIDDVAWFSGNTSNKQPVATKEPNELDIYDMSGNVYEFVQESNVLRGGGWNSDDEQCAVTYRLTTGVDQQYIGNDTGLRLAATNLKKLIGDVNGDGRVNVSDVSALINMILGLEPMNKTTADVNNDGRVNVSDVAALINIILGIT